MTNRERHDYILTEHTIITYSGGIESPVFINTLSADCERSIVK